MPHSKFAHKLSVLSKVLPMELQLLLQQLALQLNF